MQQWWGPRREPPEIGESLCHRSLVVNELWIKCNKCCLPLAVFNCRISYHIQKRGFRRLYGCGQPKNPPSDAANVSLVLPAFQPINRYNANSQTSVFDSGRMQHLFFKCTTCQNQVGTTLPYRLAIICRGLCGRIIHVGDVVLLIWTG
jgi:hypothetical protein